MPAHPSAPGPRAAGRGRSIRGVPREPVDSPRRPGQTGGVGRHAQRTGAQPAGYCVAPALMQEPPGEVERLLPDVAVATQQLVPGSARAQDFNMFAMHALASDPRALRMLLHASGHNLETPVSRIVADGWRNCRRSCSSTSHWKSWRPRGWRTRRRISATPGCGRPGSPADCLAPFVPSTAGRGQDARCPPCRRVSLHPARLARRGVALAERMVRVLARDAVQGGPALGHDGRRAYSPGLTACPQ